MTHFCFDLSNAQSSTVPGEKVYTIRIYCHLSGRTHICDIATAASKMGARDGVFMEGFALKSDLQGQDRPVSVSIPMLGAHNLN